MENKLRKSDSNAVKKSAITKHKKISDEEDKGNPRLANALMKAIRMGKSRNGESLVLSKAKLYSPRPTSKKAYGFEIVPGPNEDPESREKIDAEPVIDKIKSNKNELKKFKIHKQEKFQRGRLKPSPLDREKEKPLIKIATKGVVQLFNAVRQQQTALNKQINKPGVTESKKEKILKSIDKKAFLDVLMGKTRSKKETDASLEVSNHNEDEVKTEPENEEPSWKVLRDDFMMGAKLKDWDKKETEIMEE